MTDLLDALVSPQIQVLTGEGMNAVVRTFSLVDITERNLDDLNDNELLEMINFHLTDSPNGLGYNMIVTRARTTDGLDSVIVGPKPEFGG